MPFTAPDGRGKLVDGIRRGPLPPCRQNRGSAPVGRAKEGAKQPESGALRQIPALWIKLYYNIVSPVNKVFFRGKAAVRPCFAERKSSWMWTVCWKSHGIGKHSRSNHRIGKRKSAMLSPKGWHGAYVLFMENPPASGRRCTAKRSIKARDGGDGDSFSGWPAGGNRGSHRQQQSLRSHRAVP